MRGEERGEEGGPVPPWGRREKGVGRGKREGDEGGRRRKRGGGSRKRERKKVIGTVRGNWEFSILT